MNRKSIIALIIAFSMMLGMTLTSCGGSKQPENLESFLKSNSEVEAQIKEAADSNAGLTLDIKENTVTYKYDLSVITGADEETIKDPAMIETLTSALDGSKDTFISLCQNLESQTNISGIQLVVEYTYGDEVLSSKTYTAEG